MTLGGSDWRPTMPADKPRVSPPPLRRMAPSFSLPADGGYKLLPRVLLAYKVPAANLCAFVRHAPPQTMIPEDAGNN